MTEEKEDKLAALAHDIWARGMKYQRDKVLFHYMSEEWEVTGHGPRGDVYDNEDYERWQRQMNTPYEELSPKEQESDKKIAREWAEAVLNDFYEFLSDKVIMFDAGYYMKLMRTEYLKEKNKDGEK